MSPFKSLVVANPDSIVAAGRLEAQGVTTSAVSGYVQDSAGAPLANAQVLITYLPTGFRTAVTTNANGLYLAQGLEPGGISDPFETPKGWRIVRLVSRHPAETSPYDAVRAELVRSLTEERMKERYAAFIESLRKDAIIETKVREVPLQVTVPTSPAPLRDVTVPPAGDDEFITTPQAAPETTRPPDPAQP